MERKIRDKSVPLSEFQNVFYENYKKQIIYLWGERKEEPVYIVNQEMEKKINEILDEGESQIIYITGNAGVGKTAFIKNFFGLSDTMIKLDEKKHRIIASLGFRGQPIETDIQQFLNNYMFLLCNKLNNTCEMSDQTELELYFFIKQHMDFLFDYVSCKELEGKDEKEKSDILISTIKKNNLYHYYTAKLAYFLHSHYSQYHNFVFVVDNMEAFRKNEQETITRDMLSLFSNMLDIASTNEQMPDFFLLFCMREETYDHLHCCEDISAFKPEMHIEMNCPVDIAKFLEEKYLSAVYSDEEKDKWGESKEIICNFTNKFGGKYSKMFNNLSNYEFDSIKRCYRKVLSNKLWLLRGERGRDFIQMSVTDHLFNNISVIRSLACGNNAVYRNEKSKILPNILLNNEFYDDSMESLLILKYIIVNKEVAAEKINQIFQSVFSDFPEMNVKAVRVVKHLLECEVIAEKFYCTKNGVKRTLKLLPKGQEIFEMLAADSVLIELYKEDHYYSDEYNTENEIPFNYSSSFDLMNDANIGQKGLFIQIFHYIKMLLTREKEIHKKAFRCNQLDLYYDCFKRRLISSYLLEGALRSVEYSGNMYLDSIQKYIAYLRDLMDNIDRFDEMA